MQSMPMMGQPMPMMGQGMPIMGQGMPMGMPMQGGKCLETCSAALCSGEAAVPCRHAKC
jgi:hypothetical protein